MLRARLTACLAGALAALAAPPAAAQARHHHHRARPSPTFYVGAARASITPTSLAGIYLGGYGIGPVHPARAVLRPVYARAIAIRDAAGRQVVIATIDAQGYFAAYQQGPYGIADIQADIARRLHIAPAHVVIESTHSHNGADAIGAWGGVPDSYLALVKARTETAIATAVARERRARLRFGTADMSGFTKTFGSDTDASATGDKRDYPVDNQLRVLQAVGPHGRVTATLVNYAAHPTVYGPLDKLSPDWPGATADYLEHAERNIARARRYGYPGSTAVVTVGALGHTWPAGVPHGASRIDPPPSSDNYGADHFGNAVARMAIGALGRGHYLTRSRVGGASRDVQIVSANPVLLAMLTAPVPGYHIMRAQTPPWAYGDVLVTRAQALRIGDLALFAGPGELFPTIHSELARTVHSRLTFSFSLAGDQLGYIEAPSDYNGAAQCSISDEWFFTISPLFGTQIADAEGANARTLGFATGPSHLDAGPLPPATNCTWQQAGMSQPQPPALSLP